MEKKIKLLYIGVPVFDAMIESANHPRAFIEELKLPKMKYNQMPKSKGQNKAEMRRKIK